MAAKWLTEDVVYVGDTYGNAVPLRIGVVRLGSRTRVAFQRQDADDTQPPYTLDGLAARDMIRALQDQLIELAKRDPSAAGGGS